MKGGSNHWAIGITLTESSDGINGGGKTGDGRGVVNTSKSGPCKKRHNVTRKMYQLVIEKLSVVLEVVWSF